MSVCPAYELFEALAPRRKSAAVRKTEAKRRAKRTETSAIYDAADDRAAGRCEACGLLFETSDGPELDHFRGRGKAQQTIENCWLLHRTCHHQRTNNSPSAAYWLERFIIHADKHGYAAEAARARVRLATVRTRGAA